MKLLSFIALATAVAVPAGAQKPTTVVPIRLQSFAYAPAPLALNAGQPVTLVFTNDSGIGHEFKAPQFFRASTVLSGNVGDGEIDLKPHQSASVTLIPQRGTYEAHCGHFMHTQLGMATTIVVQ